jgi:hypothetical protein
MMMMMERREFFEVTIDFSKLENHALSSDSTMRWASAIELGQLGTEDAISLLWSLTTDADENVRDAAKLGLNQCDQKLLGKVLATKWVVEPERKRETQTQGVEKHIPWKVRPLEVPSPENEWAVDAAVLNIIQTEGPLTGARLLRLYGNATYPNNPRKLPKSRIQTAFKRLERRGLVSHIQDFSAGEIEYWTLYANGSAEVLVREQGLRKLGEIPVTEVIARLKLNMGDEFEYASQDDRFQILLNVYAIKQAELHIVGDILAKEWSSLLSI